MRNTKIFITLLLVLIGSGMAQGTTIEVCNTCGNTTITDAMAFAVDGDVLTVTSDLLIENMNLISKAVTVEGNGHTVNISLSTSSEKGIEIHNTPVVINNLTLNITKNWNTAILLNSTDFGGRTWNNVRIEVAETVPSTLSGVSYPDNVAGIALWGSSNLTLQNYTTHDVMIPLWTRDSNYGIQRKATNITIVGGATFDRIVGNMFSDGSAGAWVDQNTEDINFDGFDVNGFTAGIKTTAWNGGTTTAKNLTYRGNLKSNTYGMRLNVYNLSIIDSVFDNSFDATVLGDTNYRITNSSFKTLVSLPNATNFNISKWAINKVVIDSIEYDVASDSGYNVTATITTLPPFNLTLGYNKSRVTALNLDPASLKVLHVNTPNETLVPTSIDTGRGTLTVQTSSFSPFVIYGTQLVSSPGVVSSGGGGGGGGSGSGGGAASSPEAFNNIANTRKVELFWNAGKQAVHVYKDIDISSVAIVPSKSIGYVEVRTEELKQKSSLAKTEPPTESGKVYKYYNIWLGTSGMASVQSAEIKFKTPLIDGKVTNAVMMRYDNKTQAWEPLETTFVSSDAQFAYYSAKTSKFSPFVIIYGLPMGGGAPVTLDTVAETMVELPMSTPTPPQPPDGTPVAQAPGFGALLAIVGVLAVAYLSRKAK